MHPITKKSPFLALAIRHSTPIYFLILLIFVWTVPHSHYSTLVVQQVQGQYAALPKVRLDLHPSNTFRNRFSNNKTALYIETRNSVNHTVAPLLFHIMQVAPPEWRFVFLGSKDLVEQVNITTKGQYGQEIGKLRLEQIEPWTEKWAAEEAEASGRKDQVELPLDEVRSRLLTNLTFYEEVLPGVEYLLSFKSNSMLCSNANKTINDFLEYDWVGSPWDINDSFGGDGALSLRRVSAIKSILSFQSRRDNTAPEDAWLSSRIGLLPKGKPASAEIEQTFSVQSIWYERPLGYHVPEDVRHPSQWDVWGHKYRRDWIYEYCPEVKIVLPMRLERERCPEPVIENTDGIPMAGTRYDN